MFKTEITPQNQEFKVIDNLFSASETDLSNIKLSIEKNNGLLWVFIHPLFGLSNPESITSDIWKSDEEDKLIHEAMENGLKNLIEKSKNDKCPLIIFENKNNKTELLNLIKTDKLNNFIGVIDTNEDDPEPLVEGGYEKMNKLFEELGVKKIVVSGMNYVVQIDESEITNTSHISAGCVEAFADNLTSQIHLQYSNFLFPDNPKILKEKNKPFEPEDDDIVGNN